MKTIKQLKESVEQMPLTRAEKDLMLVVIAEAYNMGQFDGKLFALSLMTFKGGDTQNG